MAKASLTFGAVPPITYVKVIVAEACKGRELNRESYAVYGTSVADIREAVTTALSAFGKPQVNGDEDEPAPAVKRGRGRPPNDAPKVKVRRVR